MSNFRLKIYRIKSFSYAALSGIRFSLGGQLGANEILALADSFSLKSWRLLYRNVPDMKKVNIAYFIMFLSQILSDVVNQSSLENCLRGWANILMAIIVTTFLARTLLKDNKAIIYYLAGMIITMVFFYQDTSEISLNDMGFMKFRLVPMLNSVVLIISWFFIKKSKAFTKYIVVLFIVYGLFNILFNARSNGIIFLLIAALLRFKNLFRGITIKKLFLYLIPFIILFQGAYIFYVSEVLTGKIKSEQSKEQFAMTSNPYNPLNLLLVGRSETYVALTAIADKPIFGHGSWAEDSTGKYNEMLYKLHSGKGKPDLVYVKSSGKSIIPSHSVILGIWMSAGFIGFICAMYIVFLFYKRVWKLLKMKIVRDGNYYTILLYFTINSLWTFIFSPLSHIKESLPIMIAFVLVFYSQIYKNLKPLNKASKQTNNKDAIQNSSYNLIE